jgi:hypothetical protein
MIRLNKMPRRQGWLDFLDDAGIWGVAWAMFAAAAGLGLATAARALIRRNRVIDGLEFDGGYNALAPHVDR